MGKKLNTRIKAAIMAAVMVIAPGLTGCKDVDNVSDDSKEPSYGSFDGDYMPKHESRGTYTTFKISKDSIRPEEKGFYEIVSQPNTLIISYATIVNGTPIYIPGVTLEVRDSHGNLVSMFTTDMGDIVIRDLKEGEKYTITEVVVPGSSSNESYSFTFVDEIASMYGRDEYYIYNSYDIDKVFTASHDDSMVSYAK